MSNSCISNLCSGNTKNNYLHDRKYASGVWLGTHSKWEISLPRGFYEITFGLGASRRMDQSGSYTNVLVENIALPSTRLEQNKNGRFVTRKMIGVPVDDGRLSITSQDKNNAIMGKTVNDIETMVEMNLGY